MPADELAEICELPNEGLDCAMMPRGCYERATSWCIQWLWEVVPMSLRGCNNLANERPQIRHAQQSVELHSIYESLVMAGARGAVESGYSAGPLGGGAVKAEEGPIDDFEVADVLTY